MRSPELASLGSEPPLGVRGALERAVALELLAEREKALCTLEHRGVQVIDADPAGLQAALVSRYLFLKARLVL